MSDFLTNWMQSPGFHLGAGLLGAPNIGAGLQSGLASFQQMKMLQDRANFRQLQAEQLKDEMERAKEQAERDEQMRKKAEQYYEEQGMADMPPEVRELTLRQQFARQKLTDDLIEYQIAQQQGYSGLFMDYMQAVKGMSRPVTKVQVDIAPPGKEKFTEKMAEKEATYLVEQSEIIPGKVDVIESLNEAEKMLESPEGIYSGFWGDVQLQASKAISANPKKSANTEAFLAYVSETVLPRMQAFGGNDSNEEMNLIRRMVGGDIKLEIGTLKRLVKSANRKLRRTVDNYRKRVDKVRKDHPDWQPPTIAEPFPGPEENTGDDATPSAAMPSVIKWSEM